MSSRTDMPGALGPHRPSLRRQLMVYLVAAVATLLVLAVLLVHQTLASAAVPRVAVLLLSGGGIVLVLLSGRFLARNITDPLQRLAEATEAVAQGDLDHTLDEHLPGETGMLAHSFNRMTDHLRRSRTALQLVNEHLEDMVRQRTTELQHANDRLRELDRLKNDFLSNVSHELRTPLTSIRSYVEILLEGLRGEPALDAQDCLQTIKEQTERLVRLIGDLLDVSQIEAGRFACEHRPTPVPPVITSCLRMLERRAAIKGIRLQDDVPADLPAVLGDSDRLIQVVSNLLDNAIKFTPANGKVTISARQTSHRLGSEIARLGSSVHGVESSQPPTADYVIVAVQDTGPGIAPADQPHIFEKFTQVGEIFTRKPEGLGLGLAITGAIVTQHGGALWVESTPGQGATFSFSIPIAAPPVAALDSASEGTPSVLDEPPDAAVDREPGAPATARAYGPS